MPRACHTGTNPPIIRGAIPRRRRVLRQNGRVSEGDWVDLPGSRWPTQVPSRAGFSALLYDLPGSVLLLPFAALFAGVVKASNSGGGVEVDPRSHRMRRGRREVAASDLHAARLLIDPDDLAGLHLQLEAPRLAFRVPLHNGREVVISERAIEILLTLLPHSSIVMPESHYDPKGKFAKYNFPSHITKDEAIALMENPPGPGDPLPVPS